MGIFYHLTGFLGHSRYNPQGDVHAISRDAERLRRHSWRQAWSAASIEHADLGTSDADGKAESQPETHFPKPYTSPRPRPQLTKSSHGRLGAHPAQGPIL